MNLKEAFQAQNKIDELLEYIAGYLSESDTAFLVSFSGIRI